MTAPTINDAVRIYSELKVRLLAAYPDLDEQTLLDTMEGETDLQERVVSICRSARESELMADTLVQMIDDMKSRADRFHKRSEHLRAIALWAMEEAGLKKILAPDMTISARDGKPRVTIIDETAIPLDYLEYKPTIKKTAIKSALESGQEVPGAQLSNAPNFLQVRTK